MASTSIIRTIQFKKDRPCNVQIPVQIGAFGSEVAPTNGKYFALRQVFTVHTNPEGETVHNGNLDVIADASVILNTQRLAPSAQPTGMKTAYPVIAAKDQIALLGIGYRGYQTPASYSTRDYVANPLPSQNGIPILPLVENGNFMPASIWDTTKLQLVNIQLEPLFDFQLVGEWLIGTTYQSDMQLMIDKWFTRTEIPYKRSSFTFIVGSTNFLP